MEVLRNSDEAEEDFIVVAWNSLAYWKDWLLRGEKAEIQEGVAFCWWLEQRTAPIVMNDAEAWGNKILKFFLSHPGETARRCFARGIPG